MSTNNGSNNGVHKDTAIATVNGNGHKPDAAIPVEHDPASSAGQTLYWDGFSPAVAQALGQPLDPELVSQRKGRSGRTFDYLEGHAVIDQANRIFGYGGWGYELVGDVTLRQVEEVDSQTGEIKTAAAYCAPVRVTVAGALPRTDIGVHPVAEDTIDGHDTAIKGAVTDGMKRAFRSFGVQFGNGFYGDQSPANGSAQPQRAPAKRQPRNGSQTNGNSGKSQTGRTTRQAQPKGGNDSQVEKLRKQLFEIAGEQGIDDDKVREAVTKRTGKGIDDLTAAELKELVDAAASRLRQMKEEQAQQAA